ncbi:hypothetical protein [Arboricoccus pini]|uniref:hypothetical protein n=1 Tax=Arboricoccus pini TaxID=1963835 RepID=UPI0013FD3ABC|nr:hypothetical protein [Arboricoccus pini]
MLGVILRSSGRASQWQGYLSPIITCNSILPAPMISAIAIARSGDALDTDLILQANRAA